MAEPPSRTFPTPQVPPSVSGSHTSPCLLLNAPAPSPGHRERGQQESTVKGLGSLRWLPRGRSGSSRRLDTDLQSQVNRDISEGLLKKFFFFLKKPTRAEISPGGGEFYPVRHPLPRRRTCGSLRRLPGSGSARPPPRGSLGPQTPRPLPPPRVSLARPCVRLGS